MTVKFSKDHEWINAADANAIAVLSQDKMEESPGSIGQGAR